MPMRAEHWLWLLPVLVLAGGFLAFWACDQVIHSFTSRPEDDEESDSAKSVRRGVTGAAFALQEVFDPGIAHVIHAQQDVRAEEADPAGGDDELSAPEAIFEALVKALVSVP